LSSNLSSSGKDATIQNISETPLSLKDYSEPDLEKGDIDQDFSESKTPLNKE
jgi:hypothetical protein